MDLKDIRKQLIRSAAAVLIAITLVISGLAPAGGAKQVHAALNVKTSTELRGVWVAFIDYESLGLYKKNKTTYTNNVRNFLKKAKGYGCNAVFFHVRSFDDAAWKSKTFNASPYLVSASKAKKKAYKAYSYDPMGIFIEEAHKQGMEFHAYMNPFRYTYEKFIDPGTAAGRNWVLKAVSEVLEYDVDGIHYDDYFYHASQGYVKPSSRGSVKARNISAAKKRKNVNKFIKATYNLVHKKKGVVFGVSPQGNYDNDMADGADVKTWLSKSGYVDYVMPQIYWTNNWGSSGNVKMYDSRVDQFKNLQKNKNVKLYVGLALYRTGYSFSDDKGWGKRKTNLKKMVKKARGSGYKGYCLFSGADMSQSHAKKELKNLKNYLK